MLRKVVRHGTSTLTVSLPLHWAKQYNVKKGDDIFMEKTGSGLLLTAKRRRTEKRKRLHISQLHNNLVKEVIRTLYCTGYSDVTLFSQKHRRIIRQSLATTCTGFEITEDSTQHVRISKLGAENGESFHALLKRMFHCLRRIADETLEAAESGSSLEPEGGMQFTRIANYCKRLLHTSRQSQYPCDVTLYHLIEQLEHIYRTYCGLCCDAPLHVHRNLNVLVRMHNAFFFKPTLEKANVFFEKHRRVVEELEEKSSDFRTIVRALDNTVRTTLALHL